MLCHLLIMIMTYLAGISLVHYSLVTASQKIQQLHKIFWALALALYPSWPSHLLSDHLGHDVSGMDIDGADSHDLLPITRCKLANQHWDESVELGDLFFVVLLHGVVIALLQTCKSHSDVRRPPDLCAGQSHLKRESETMKWITSRLITHWNSSLWFSLVFHLYSLWAKTSSKCKTNLGIVPTKAHKTYGPICFLHKNAHHWKEM